MKNFIFASMAVCLLSFTVEANVPVNDDQPIITVVDRTTGSEVTIQPILDVYLLDETLDVYRQKNVSFEFIKAKSFLDIKTNTVVDVYQLDNNKTLTVEYNLAFNNSCWWSASNGTVSVIDTAGPGAVVTYYDTSGNVTRRYVTSDTAARDVCAMMK